MPKIIKFSHQFADNDIKKGCTASYFVIPDEDIISKDFILEKIESILTDEEDILRRLEENKQLLKGGLA